MVKYLGIEVIMDGRMMGENLSRLGVNAAWLLSEVRAQGYDGINLILLGIYQKESDTLTLFPNE
jgi:uncharacterized membrane protein YcaP (DUF421 family)